jgi:hypothetical protein
MSANQVDRDPDEISRNSAAEKSGFAPARHEKNPSWDDPGVDVFIFG